MQKLMLVLATLGAATMAVAGPHGTTTYGGRVNYDRLVGHYTGSGGEFTLQSDLSQGSPGLLLNLAAYANSVKNLDGGYSFQSFCLELDEHLAEPMNIYVSEQNAALNGPGSHAWLGGANTDSGDDLDVRTAYLYTKFAQGQLAGYEYDDAGPTDDDSDGWTRNQTAAALQQLIWYLEGEVNSLTSTAGNINLAAIKGGAALTLAQNWLAEATNANWASIGNVRILQMFRTNGANAQDQLYLAVPAPAAALLGVLGLGATIWFKRRLS